MLESISRTDRNLIALLHSIPDRVFVISRSGVFLDVFGGADTHSVYSSDKVLGMSFTQLFPTERAESFQSVVTKTLDTQKTQKMVYSFDPESTPPLPDGVRIKRTQWFESRIHPLPEQYKGQDAVIWVVRNITDSEELKRKLHHHATTDHLTGVMNRRSFLSAAEDALVDSQRNQEDASLLMLDIDEFKSVNDSYGHDTGDMVLSAVVSVLTKSIREIDLVGRLGGEEFAILLPHSNEAAAVQVADRICGEVRHLDVGVKPQLHLSVSIGVASLLASDKEIKQVLKKADRALYHAKRTGKDKYVPYSLIADAPQQGDSTQARTHH